VGGDFHFSWAGFVVSALLMKFKITSIDDDSVETFEKTAVGFHAYLPDIGRWPGLDISDW